MRDPRVCRKCGHPVAIHADWGCRAAFTEIFPGGRRVVYCGCRALDALALPRAWMAGEPELEYVGGAR